MGVALITIGKLLRKADKNDTGIIIRGIRNGMGLFFLGRYAWAIRVINPDCLIPSLTRKRTAIVSIPLLEKPDTISSAEIIPAARKMVAALKRISPGRMNSRIKATMR
jgi:hypothetical protein